MAATQAAPRRASWVAIALAVLVGLCVPVAVLGSWVHDDLVDEDGWYDALAPLADDDEFVADLAGATTARVLDVAGAGLRASIPLLPGSAVDAVQDRLGAVVEPAVRRVLDTELAGSAWEAAVRRAHPQVLALLDRRDSALVDGDRIVVDLSPLAGGLRRGIAGALDLVDLPLGIDLSGIEDPLGLEGVTIQITLVDLGDTAGSLDAADRAERARLPLAALSAVAAVVAVAVARRRALVAAVAGATSVVVALVLRTAVVSGGDGGPGAGIDRAVDALTDGGAARLTTTALFAAALAATTGALARRRPT